MRETYRGELAVVGELLSAMAEGVARTMREATEGLLKVDRAAAEGVVADTGEVQLMYRQVEEKAYELLALQAPVARDLRTIVTALHVAADLERMSHLAAHVAKTALRRYPEPALAPELTEVFGGMAEVAGRMALKMVEVVRDQDVDRAAELEHDDDVMDALHRRMFETLVGTDWPHGVEAAVDAALLGRYYERYGDHAVNAADQVIYLVTGETPSPA
jgi:phosphate transport system protein